MVRAQTTPSRAASPKSTTRTRAEGSRRTLAADPVFNSLVGAILRGKFKPGSALPPERELAALFNVSRLIVRQALHRLREIGLVRGGQGGQNTVLDPDDASDPRIVALTMQIAPKPADERDVEERQLMGGANLIELATERASEAELDGLARILEEAGAAAEEPIDFEAKWWLALAAATKNRILLRETRWWFEVLRDQPERSRRGYGGSEFQLRLALYKGVLERMRTRDEPRRFYLSLIRSYLRGPTS